MKPCDECGAEFRPRGAQTRCLSCRTQVCPTCQTEFLTGRRGRVYCSRQCLGSDADNIERLQRVRGRKPRTYATRERTKHGSAEQREWRTAVFQRDEYTCQMCGAKGVRLQADHIQPYSTHPELRFDLANGRTLCEPCHQQTPTYGWRGYWLKRRQADEIAARRLSQDTLFGDVTA